MSNIFKVVRDFFALKGIQDFFKNSSVNNKDFKNSSVNNQEDKLYYYDEVELDESGYEGDKLYYYDEVELDESGYEGEWDGDYE